MTRIRTALMVVMATAYVSAAGPIDISVGNVQTAFGASIVVSVNVSEVVALDSLRAYEFALIYDPTVLTLTGTDVLGSLSSNIAVYAGVPYLDGLIEINPTSLADGVAPDSLAIAAGSADVLVGGGKLIGFKFDVIGVHGESSAIGITGIDGSPLFNESELLLGTVTGGVVTVVNQAPTLAPITNKLGNEGVELSFTVQANDLDLDIITYSVTGAPGATIDGEGRFAWTPNFYQAGTWPEVVVTARDNGLPESLSASRMFEIEIGNFNRLPNIIAPAGTTLSETEAMSFVVTATDPDTNDNLTLSVNGKPSAAIFTSTPSNTPNTGVFSWTTDNFSAGVHNVSFSVSDGVAQTSVGRKITVINVNRSPEVGVSGTLTVAEGEDFKVNIQTSDPDREPVRVNIVGLPRQAIYSPSAVGGGVITWTTTGRDANEYPLTISATDVVPRGTTPITVTQQITLTVTDVPFAPVFTSAPDPPPAQIVRELGQILTLAVKAVDSDGGTITYTDDAAFFVINPTTGQISYQAVQANAGTHDITITADDGNQQATTVFRLVIRGDQTPPHIVGNFVKAEVLGENSAVISWKTNEPATSVVNYGIDGGARAPAGSGDLVLNHVVTLEGLTEGQPYGFDVSSADEAGNPSVAVEGTFQTKRADHEAPRLVGMPSVIPSTTSAIVKWETDEFSTSQVRYGPGFSLATPLHSDLLFSVNGADGSVHTVEITGLTAATIYSFQVVSVDKSLGENTLEGPVRSFRTLALPDVTAPVITKPLTLASVSHNQLTVAWMTNEPATSILEYGRSTAYGDIITDNVLTLKHVVTVSPLEPGTLYHFRATAYDGVPNGPTVGADFEVWTLDAPDVTPPAFQEVPAISGISNVSVTVSWKTNEAARAEIKLFDRSDVRLAPVVITRPLAQSHSVRLTKLTPRWFYNVEVNVWDANGNGPTSYTTEDFQMQANPDTDAPNLLGRVLVQSITDKGAQVGLKADEPHTLRIEFGTHPDSLLGLIDVTDAAPAHNVALSGLKPSRIYLLRITMTDASNNKTAINDITFPTQAEPDFVPPVVVAGPFVEAQLVDEATNQAIASIYLKTDELSTVIIAFGQGGELKRQTSSSDAASEHHIRLDQLDTRSVYNYQITMIDDSQNHVTVDSIYIVRTIRGLDKTRPSILAGPSMTAASSDQITIQWETDEVASAVLEIGPYTNNLKSRASRTSFSKEHTLTVTNLDAATEYSARVISTDPSGNTGRSLVFQVETKAVPDVTPPVFSEMPSAGWSGANRVKIDWRTDEVTDGQVFYAPYEIDDFKLVSDQRFAQKNSITITGLQNGTSYKFLVVSADPSGNIAAVGDPAALQSSQFKITRVAGGLFRIAAPGAFGNFTTKQSVDNRAPVITDNPSVIAPTTTGASVTWGTDEQSSTGVYVIPTDTLNSIVAAKVAAGAKVAADGESPDVQALLDNGTLITSTQVNMSHMLTVSQLESNTLYSVMTTSTDPVDNGETLSQIFNFTTASAVDLSSLQVDTASINSNVTNVQAVVRWRTDKLSDSRVEFGLSEDALDREQVIPERTLDHSVTLTNLTAETQYHFKIFSSAGDGLSSGESGFRKLTTQQAPDVTPPAISSPSFIKTFTDRAVVIEWDTDELSDSNVEYGISKSFGQDLTNLEDVTHHRMTVTGLYPNTEYFFRVASIDRVNNGPTVGEILSQVTAAAPDSIAPALPTGMTVLAGSEQLKLTWSPSPDDDISGYTIRRQEVGGESFVIASGLSDHEYQDNNVENGVEYLYTIVAVDLSLNETIEAAFPAVTPGTDEAPSRPYISLIEFNSRGQIVVPVAAVTPAMSRPDDPITYTFILTEDAALQNVIATTNVYCSCYSVFTSQVDGVTRWTISMSGMGLEHNTTYYLVVQANDGTFSSPVSLKKSFRTEPTSVELSALAAVSNPGGINLSWVVGGNSDEVTKMLVERGENLDGPFAPVGDLSREGTMAGSWTDLGVIAGRDYVYRLVLTSTNGASQTAGPVTASAWVPTEWALGHNRPNPFNPSTIIPLAVPQADQVRLVVYDFLGQEIATLYSGHINPGLHSFRWDGLDSQGRAVASSVYLVRLTSESFTATRRLLLVR